MNIIERAKKVFEQEIAELSKVAQRIDTTFEDVVNLILDSNNKIVVIGIGKTGHIGKKIAASLSSTGTPAIFVNAAEAAHGDLGMVTRKDIVIAISNSGASQEITNIIPSIKKLECTLVAFTSNPNSPLALQADYVIDIAVDSEAGEIGLAPTTSTTTALVMGDALTICLMEKRNFKPENFALYHPGGALGRRLLTKVKDCMTNVVPLVLDSATFKEVVAEVTIKKLGVTMVQNSLGDIVGIITDGDIRRAVEKYDDLHSLKAIDIMSKTFKSISQNELVNDALEIMDLNKITTLAVVESNKTKQPIIGILHIHNIYGFR